MPGERPYVKYAESGGDTIHVAYTNAHPGEFGSVNLHYVRIRGGLIERANGDDVGSLAGPPIAPGAGDTVFDRTEPCWVHDVAVDAAGRPVIVFASLLSRTDHRYWYARWTGSAWATHAITPAGGTFREDGGSPYYSGGLTLDHEDPSRVYLSRQVGAGWHVESWATATGGATWSSVPVATSGKNVRPVSPRGLFALSGDLSVVWMKGSYPNYVDYATTIMGVEDGSLPPVADVEAAVRAGPAPLEVRFDASTSRDPDPGGRIVSWQWSFGDGSTASGEEVTHTYASGGRYFPRLTVTDVQGQSSTFVDEIAVDVPTAPTVHTGGAEVNTVHGAVDPENQPALVAVRVRPNRPVRRCHLRALARGVQLAAAGRGRAAGSHVRAASTTTGWWPRTAPAARRARIASWWLAASVGRMPTATPFAPHPVSPPTGASVTSRGARLARKSTWPARSVRGPVPARRLRGARGAP